MQPIILASLLAAFCPIVFSAPAIPKEAANLGPRGDKWLPNLPYPEGFSAKTCPRKNGALVLSGALEKHPKRSLEEAEEEESSTNALIPRADVCGEIGRIDWIDLADWAANTRHMALVTGQRYVLSFAVDMIVRSVRVWGIVDNDFVNFAEENFNAQTGTMTWIVKEAVSVHLEIRFSQVWSSGTLSLFALPPK